MIAQKGLGYYGDYTENMERKIIKGKGQGSGGRDKGEQKDKFEI